MSLTSRRTSVYQEFWPDVHITTGAEKNLVLTRDIKPDFDIQRGVSTKALKTEPVEFHTTSERNRMSSSVIDAFKRLNMSTAQDSADHEAVFEVSYQYLSKVKNFADINAFHNCIVSLINRDRYYRALQLLDEVSSDIHDEFPVEKAYVYYKTGDFDKLKTLYGSVTSQGNSEPGSITQRALKHVMAQSYYQNGHVEEALSLYRELISTNSVDNEVDMACNERAILSQFSVKDSLLQLPASVVTDAEKTYDILFNDALIALANGNTSASLNLLEKASSVCLEQNMDSNPADLALEVAPIKLTEAYIHQLLGDAGQALNILKSMDLEGVTDLMTRLVFRNNYATLSEVPENLNYSARELNYKDNLHHLRHKLTKPQYQIVMKNNLLLSYQTGTLSKDSNYFRNKVYSRYAMDFPGDVTPLLYRVLMKFGMSMRAIHSPSEAKRITRRLFTHILMKLAQNDIDDETIASCLLLVHLNSKSGNYDQTISALEKVVAIELDGAPEKMHGSIFGILIHIYEARPRSAKRHEELVAAITTKFAALSPKVVAGNESLYNFVRAFAFLQSVGSDAEKMTPILNILNEANAKDALVSSALDGDLSGLLPAEELASSTNVEDLLLVNIEDIIPNQPATKASLATKTNASSYKVTKKPQKPRFSKSKVVRPASEFNADKDLDKERWLPMKLRSYYKPSKRELKKRTGGHQGAVEQSPAPSSAPAAASSSSKSKSKSKSKKKKGKK